MRQIGFNRTGQLGGPMAANLINQHQLRFFDLAPAAAARLAEARTPLSPPRVETSRDSEIVYDASRWAAGFSDIYLGHGKALIGSCSPAVLLIEFCSTIDVATAREVERGRGRQPGWICLDAPVSAAWRGAHAGALTFIAAATSRPSHRPPYPLVAWQNGDPRWDRQRPASRSATHDLGISRIARYQKLSHLERNSASGIRRYSISHPDRRAVLVSTVLLPSVQGPFQHPPQPAVCSSFTAARS